MTIHMQREIERLKKMILSLFATVEERVQMAVRALNENDSVLAKEVVSRDDEVDEFEVEVEEECLKILALHQPVAIDLRFVIATLKINNDLERIGDLAVSVSKKVVRLAKGKPVEALVDFATMAEKTQTMLRQSLDAFIKLDMELAQKTCAMDDEVDDMKREARKTLEDAAQQDPSRLREYNILMGATRNLERIADLATNIAEDVLYMVDGHIARHETSADD